MNWLDVVIIVLIAIPTLIGLRTGIIKATLSLAGCRFLRRSQAPTATMVKANKVVMPRKKNPRGARA